MRIHALDIPEDTSQLAGWLERHLVGLDLASLVAELTAIHKPPAEQMLAVRQVLGKRLDAVLQDGLRIVPPTTLKLFLLRPSLLTELQDLVLAAGGDYWKNLACSSTEQRTLIEEGRTLLQTYLETGKRTPRPAEQPPILKMPARTSWYRRPWVVSLATAAAVLVGVISYRLVDPPIGALVQVASADWGWNKPDAFPRNENRQDYLNHLADEAQEWFKKPPDDPQALAKRIGEFRQGCSQLLLAGLDPLKDQEDRKWLAERCLKWSKKMDDHLADLETGKKDAAGILQDANQTVQALIDALRKHAQTSIAS